MKNLRDRLFSNWVLKLISLTVAFILWFVVISTQDPVDDKTFNNIKVNMINTHVLEEKDMVYEVLNGTDILKSVTLEAPKTVRDAILPSDIVAEADFEYLTHSDTVPIKISCPKYSGKVSGISGNISSVKLNIEEEVVKYIDIKSNIIGDVADGFMIGNISLDQNRLEISGPASKIAEIRKAMIDVNVADIANDISTRGKIYLLDSDGNELNYTSVVKNVDSVRVEVDVLTIKDVLVEYLSVGEPADGYKVAAEAGSTVRRVKIAGNNAVLSGITKITVPAEVIDITDATDKVERIINLKDYLPEGTIFADSDFDSRVTVSVDIEAIEEKQLAIDLINVQISNIPEGLKATLAQEDEVILKVRGLRRDIDSLRDSTMLGIVNVTNWAEINGITAITPGTYQMPIAFSLKEGQEQVEDVMISVKLERADS